MSVTAEKPPTVSAAPPGAADPGASRGNEGNIFNNKAISLYDAKFDATWEIDVFGHVRRQMEAAEVDSLALYPERRHSEAPTAQLVFNALEGHRRHRLLDEHGHELRRFYDELPDAAQEVLDLLGVDGAPYGLN